MTYIKEMMKEIYLPSPSSISYMWNFGSLLIVCLMMQIITGFFLSMHYSASIEMAFDSIIHMNYEVNNGWLIRFFHYNGATMFFILIYTHMMRGIYYKSFFLNKAWMVGALIYLILMMTSFLGYILPWGQMSYWGATVITNLISTIPYLGKFLVEWVWGGFSVGQPTLIRFYSLHFILPFVILALSMMHVMMLHTTGSSNPLGCDLDSDKISFHPFFTIKDILGLMFYLTLFSMLLMNPFMFMDPDNSISANPMVTPVHIKPEWYFLFAYAILRSIPNKLGGVLALLCSVMIIMLLPLKKKINNFSYIYKISCIIFCSIFFLLTWIGGMPVEYPFSNIGMFLSFLYFFNMFLIFML